MDNDVTPLSSIGCIAFICAIVRTFQISITPLVSLDINKLAFAIKLVIPD